MMAVTNPLGQWTPTGLVESYYGRPAYDFASYLQQSQPIQQQQQYTTTTNTSEENGSAASPNAALTLNGYQQHNNNNNVINSHLYGLENSTAIKREDGLTTITNSDEPTQQQQHILASATDFAMANAAILNQHQHNNAFSHLFRNPFNDPLMKGMVESAAGQMGYTMPTMWDQQAAALAAMGTQQQSHNGAMG